MAAQRIPLITVFGSLNIDLVSYVSHHPEPGETLTSSSFKISTGGKGANQAVACAKLSRSRPATGHQGSSTAVSDGTVQEDAYVRMVGAIGSDSFGELLINDMAAAGVDMGYVVVREPPTRTGIAVIVVEVPAGQNRIILSPLANHSWVSLLGEPRSADEVLAILGPPLPDLLIMQLEIPVPVMLMMLRAAKEKGVPVLLNPAPVQKLPDEAFEGLQHLVVNELEATELANWPQAELVTEAEMEKVSYHFLRKGVENIIITLGGKGVYYSANGGKNKGLVPASKVHVLDTTAAGDTFIGQYALEMMATWPITNMRAAILKANQAAGKTVERLGAQESIPWRDEL